MALASKLKLAWEAACLLTEKILKKGPEMDLASLNELDTPPALQSKRTWRIASPRFTPGTGSVCDGRVSLFIGSS